MAKLKSIRSDLTLEIQGAVFTYPGTDIRVRIARLGNPHYDEAARRLRKHTKARAAANGELSERESKDLLAPAVAHHIILGWENVQDDDGKTLEFSPENAMKLLKDPELHDFYDWVLRMAGDAESFRKEIVSESVGN